MKVRSGGPTFRCSGLGSGPSSFHGVSTLFGSTNETDKTAPRTRSTALMLRRHPLATYFALAYGISWLLWAPLWLPVLPFHHALGALGPITAAFLVSAMETGLAGSLDLFRRMGLWRGRLVWGAVALLVPFALLALAAIGTALIGGESLSLAGFGSSREFPQFSALGFLAYNIVSFGYGEEVGWRGFALPRLQTRHSAFVATLLLTQLYGHGGG